MKAVNYSEGKVKIYKAPNPSGEGVLAYNLDSSQLEHRFQND